MSDSLHTTTAFTESMMRRAIANATEARRRARPNPWVGAVVVDRYGGIHDGATERPGSRHAERVALDHAGTDASGGTLFTTLEPCGHTGRTGPCTEAIIESGVRQVVVGVLDPDPNVAGTGVASLRHAKIEVTIGVEQAAVEAQLAPYLTHRRTGRPRVILKLATTLDGHIAAPDGSSTWITGPEARADVHRLRADSDAIVVGAKTLRLDDPSLTVRDFTPADAEDDSVVDPWRIVLASGPEDVPRKAEPYEVWSESIDELLDELGRRDMLQVLVEGGAGVAGSFHRAGLVDAYHVYVAPALMGGDDARSAFGGAGASTMADVVRGRFESVTPLGDDLRIVWTRSTDDEPTS